MHSLKRLPQLSINTKAWDYTLFPRCCLLCESTISMESVANQSTPALSENIHENICEACYPELPQNDPACTFCALPIPTYFAHQQTLCGRCADETWYVDQVFAPYRYADGIKYLIGALKFGKRLSLIRTLAELFLQKLPSSQYATIDYLLPIPAHPKRLHQRGFNQSYELAKYLSKALERPLLDQHLQKYQSTVAQSSLSAKQRQQNLHHVFRLKKALPPQARIAIVDDVITTGSTINAVAQHLQQGGATHLQAWSIARTDLRD